MVSATSYVAVFSVLGLSFGSVWTLRGVIGRFGVAGIEECSIVDAQTGKNHGPFIRENAGVLIQQGDASVDLDAQVWQMPWGTLEDTEIQFLLELEWQVDA